MENILDIVSQILKNENIPFSNIKRASSGFTNDVFFVDKNFVIKLSNDDNKKWRLQKEVNLYKTFKFDFVPQLVASGEFDNYDYLIISQIKGKSLYSIWHKLDNQSRKEIVKHIASILRQFHQTKATLPKFDEIKNWEKYWKSQIKEINRCLKAFDIENVEASAKMEESLKFMGNNNYCLIYNDAHFDNFIYDNGKLSLIDFDRVLFCPVDYELMIIKSMCDEPWKFANEEDEKNTKIEDYQNIIPWLKEFYPEMFEVPHLEERLKLYQFHYYFSQAYARKDKNWITKLLDNFTKS